MRERRLLLDTHILIWASVSPNNLSRHLRDVLEDYNNILFLSIISLMEIAIKNRDKKLSLGEDYETFVKNIKRFGVEILNMEPRHLITLNKLTYPKNHKDPFDHMIIAQAITDKLCLVSADGKMPYYRDYGLDLFEEKI